MDFGEALVLHQSFDDFVKALMDKGFAKGGVVRVLEACGAEEAAEEVGDQLVRSLVDDEFLDELLAGKKL